MEIIRERIRNYTDRITPVIGILSSILYVADVGTDIALAVSYYYNDHIVYFGLTLAFIIIPAIITNLYSCVASRDENRNETSLIKYCRYGFHICCLGTLFTLIKNTYYNWILKKLNIVRIAKVMLLYESMFESIPQLYLQVYILIGNSMRVRDEFNSGFHPGILQNSTNLTNFSTFQMNLQIISICISCITASWCVTDILRSEDFRGKNLLTTFFYHLFSLVSRLFPLVFFASVFTYWCLIAIIVRLCVTTLLFRYFDQRNIVNAYVAVFFYFCTGFGFVSVSKSIVYFYFRVFEDTLLVVFWVWISDHSRTQNYWLCVGVYSVAIILELIFTAILTHSSKSPNVLETVMEVNEDQIILTIESSSTLDIQESSL